MPYRYRPHGSGINAPYSVMDTETGCLASECESLSSYAEAADKAAFLNARFGYEQYQEWDWN